ncbi:hypothetical protein PF005_g18651 [Phytophthora fragariae]|uniref:Uncharacterized protein n=1 Tax=Phytophthora fragariae TaxID=53985 RepID=A0A6A4CNH7_9STRA|nr:hypothetical protein PF009_g19572 [Phytophthora fragariae]KAE8991582.1 hypothetical protein PF011_g17894 [Phytophthora fragariae]KAE9122583.1 hypothetical protein PF006_g17613 [Phytophthora fragariae]KAE9191928.1 hypothetical protein PF005_g18651 [Phytophthora fragariae]KAE9293634.1 hypothetical protein PF001_g18167 [Phytophthora fragariae]
MCPPVILFPAINDTSQGFTFRLLQRYPRHGSSLDETLAHSVDVLPDNQVKTDCTVCYRVEACQPAGR